MLNTKKCPNCSAISNGIDYGNSGSGSGTRCRCGFDPSQMEIDIKTIVADSLYTQYWCDFHNACMREDEDKVRQLIEIILGSIEEDAYLADVQFQKCQGCKEVTLNIYAFYDFPTAKLWKFCKLLSDSRLKVRFSWFAHMASDDDDEDIPKD